MATVDCGFGEWRAPCKAHDRHGLIGIHTATAQVKILTLSLRLMSCTTLGKSFNLPLQMRKLRLCTLISLARSPEPRQSSAIQQR